MMGLRLLSGMDGRTQIEGAGPTRERGLAKKKDSFVRIYEVIVKATPEPTEESTPFSETTRNIQLIIASGGPAGGQTFANFMSWV